MGKKKMLFPLEMRNGEKVHTLEELREKFDIGRALVYAESGRLVKWLQDRGADELAERIGALDKDSEDYARGICEVILGEASEVTLKQIEAAKAEKERAEKEAEEQAKREAQQAEARRRKEEEERRKEAEEKRKEEERKKESPVMLVNGKGIYIVDENRVKLCKKFPEDSGDWCFGVVQEGRDIYYLERAETAGVVECFIRRLQPDTGKDERVCETEGVCLCGVRDHRLICTKQPPDQRNYFEIVTMDLDTLKKQEHKIEELPDCRPIYTWFPFGPVAHLTERESYPHINADGTHIYCEMTKGVMKKEYAEISLKDDKISVIFSPEIARGGFSGGWIGWGVGKQGFVFGEIDDSFSWLTEKEVKARCIYYDMGKRQMRQLNKLEKAFCASSRPDRICCGEERIYWMKMKVHFGSSWRFVQEIVLTEYNISTDKLIERVRLNESDFGDEFNYKLGPDDPEIFVDDHYLYMNKFYKFLSWRFSLDNWKAEKLVQDGQDYKYIPVTLHS